MRPRPHILATVLICAFWGAGPAAAEGWETVVRENGRVVALDPESILDAEAGVRVAWARMRLSEDQAREAGYISVHALNRYNCREATFQTVRRRYLDERNLIVRVEEVAEPRSVQIGQNGVDQKLWQRVCESGVEREAASARQDADIAPEVARIASDVERIAGVLGGLSTSGPARAPSEVSERAATPPAPEEPEPPAPPPREEVRSQPSVALDWSYDSGVTGPENWGDLREEWAQCRDGRRQSPIDIDEGMAVDLEPVAFGYRHARFRVVDTGRKLRIAVGPGQSAEIRGRRYELKSIQVHRPAQEHVQGVAHDLSLSMLHRADNGDQAVVTLLARVGERPQPVIQSWLNNLPLDRGGQYAPRTPMDLAALLPESPAHYLYKGSLTTPPCTEDVVHVVMQQPLTVSWEQFHILSRLHPPNSRPLQPRNERLILQSR